MDMTIREEIRETIIDWGKYMDTTVPRGTNRQLYTSLKYSNKERMRNFCNKHKNIDRVLLEKVAIADFLLHDEEYIIRKCKQYIDNEE